LQTRLAERQAIAAQIESLIQQLEQTPDTTTEIQGLEQQLQQRRRQLDLQLGELGVCNRCLTSWKRNRFSTINSSNNFKVRRQYRVYQELAQAFGKWHSGADD